MFHKQNFKVTQFIIILNFMFLPLADPKVYKPVKNSI